MRNMIIPHVEENLNLRDYRDMTPQTCLRLLQMKK